MASRPTTINETGEFGFIQAIQDACVIQKEGIAVAIGDDAAAFTPKPNRLSLITTDLLIEGVHFLKNAISGYELGHKALAVNLSDIAAMGGQAEHAFISIAIPKSYPLDYLTDIYKGLKGLAKKFKVNILGGDTTGSLNDLVINIAVYGSVAKSALLTRSAAMPGDQIVLSGPLGGSKAGLYLIQNGIEIDNNKLEILKKMHLLPLPRLREGQFLASQAGIHAAIDISDGLANDIKHIANAGNVGLRIHADRIPIPPDLHYFCERFKINPIDFAVSGGEDYELLCTIAKDKVEQISAAYLRVFKSPLVPIGEITATKSLEMVQTDGTVIDLSSISSWDHFK